ncbi:hypothetical protein BDV28DRAFT_160463 [Aspergillus coremiiformis]|uniref:Tse2 ADP-ribosyltransferase toxin domain-containing protein n=1 Tax=Aspergillus coremiiformis TaxID=138285 RepID=A0A5N6YVF5_9EURO|nr:hypothetical protein BDV28DRAFT_160463 [Aspergillus coremiiformis]
MAKYLGYFNIFPKELFRMSNSRIIRVRDGAVKKTGSIDVISEDGKLKPKALQSDTYSSPNGISMRPNTEFQHANVSTFRGKKLIVYCVPAGNTGINKFFKKSARVMTREKWLQVYPKPTEQA